MSGEHLLDIVEETVDEGQCDKGITQSLVGINLISSRNNSPEIEDDTSSDGRGQVNGTTTEVVDKESESSVDNKTLSLHTSVNTQLSFSFGDTDSVHDTLEVVRDKTVATPLTEETKSSDETNSLAVTLGLQEVHPTSLTSFLVKSNGSLDFTKLELDELIIHIALSMVV